MEYWDWKLSSKCFIVYIIRFIAPQRAKRAGGHTKPLQAQEGHESRHQDTQVPQFDGESPSLTEIWDIISPTKLCLMTKSHILRQTARTEFLPQHFYFFQKHFFEFRFMQNVLRDFQKKIHHKKWPFSKPFSRQKQ